MKRTDEQEQGGAVQSAEGFHEQLEKLIIGDALDCDAVELIRERDAAIRRAAIEECAAWLRRIDLMRTAQWLTETMSETIGAHEAADLSCAASQRSPG